jgi:hypothetical protein
MLRIGGNYTVFVGDNTIRRFTDDTLPDFLKSKLAMILASSQNIKHDHDVDKLDIYTNSQSPELDTVGWRVSDSYFCLVMDRETLNSLKHGAQYGTSKEVDDRRRV